MRAVALLLVATALGETRGAFSSTFTVYSDPIELRYGEVHNRLDRVLPLPADVVARYAKPDAPAMAVTNFTMDIVRVDANKTETRVPLYDHYLHHYILDMGSSADLEALRRATAAHAEGTAGPGLRRMQQTSALRHHPLVD